MNLLIRLTILLPVFAVASLTSGAATPADELRELDDLRNRGIISEEVYKQRWKEVIERGIAGEPATTATAVPKLTSTPAVKRTPEPTRGRFELALSGSWSEMSAGDVDMTTASGAISAGFFATPHIEILADGIALHADIDGLDLTAFGGALGLDLHLIPEAPIVPYVGAGAGWYMVDFEGYDDDDWAWNVRAGLKHYLNRNVAVKYQVQYQSFDKLDLDGFGATVGFIFVF